MPKASLANRYLDAWNSHDPDKVLSFFNKDATYTDSGLNEQVAGNHVGHYIEKIITLCPDVEFELLDGGITGSGRAAVQWRARGNRLQRLCPHLQVGEINSVCGLDYIVHDHGRLLSTHVYFDLLPVSSQQQQPVTRQYQKSGLNDEEMQTYQQQLMQMMQSQQLYLQNDLTLVELAAAMGISTNHLSQVINGQFGYNFYELLNHFRIERAKELLHSIPAQEKVSTLDIAFESGFGSVSAFYRAFQQQLHMTPVQYRKRYC